MYKPSKNCEQTELWTNGPFLEMPRVRLSISGVKSRTNPETPWKRSQCKFWISRFRTVGDPQTLENKAYSLPRLISEFCYPEYGWYPFLFWKAPLYGTARAGHEIPNSTGGTSEIETQGFFRGFLRWGQPSPAGGPPFGLVESSQEPLNAPFLNGLFSSGFSRGKTVP